MAMSRQYSAEKSQPIGERIFRMEVGAWPLLLFSALRSCILDVLQISKSIIEDCAGDSRSSGYSHFLLHKTHEPHLTGFIRWPPSVVILGPHLVEASAG